MKKEELLNFYEKFKLFIFPAVVAVSSLMLIVFVIYPQVTKLLSNQQIAAELKNKSKTLDTKAQALENYNPDDLDLKVKSALSSFPSEKDYITVLRLLQNIVAQSGFTTVSLSLGGSSEKGAGTQSYGLKLDVLGQVTKLADLLSNIESSYRLMRVSGLETSPGKDSQISASFNIDVLYAQAPNDFGSVDSPLPQLSEKEQAILGRLESVAMVNQEKIASQSGLRGKVDPFE